jgi:peroxiredoxin
VGVVAAVHLYQGRDVPAGQAPEFAARLLDGAPVSLNDFRGRPLLLHFWATWCPVCTLAQGGIHRIAEDHAVLTIALDTATDEEIRRWMRDQGVSYPVIRDPAAEIAGRFGVRGVPTSVIVDAHGQIRFATVGYTTEPGLRLRLWWVDR